MQGVKTGQARVSPVADGETGAHVRQVVERRLVWERSAFLGLLAAFVVVLFSDTTPDAAMSALILALVVCAAQVGAGYDGAREAVADVGLIAGLVQRAGAGARVERMPFWMRGHYELWVRTPGPDGGQRFGLSFANSLLAGARRSVYMVAVPVPGGASAPASWAEPRAPLRERLVAVPGSEKTVEFFMRRARGGDWLVRSFVRPGRPVDAATLWEVKQRAAALAEAVAREGPGAVAWGTTERFVPPGQVGAGEPGSVALREP